MKKIVALTMIRSDYDLMSPLYRLLNHDDEIELKLLVGGAHLSHSFGYTVKQIEADGFSILARIESLIDSNSKAARIKSFSILLQSSIDAIAQYNPDMILYAGDREDVMLGALIGGYLGIPTLHFYGGDHVLDGHIDNPIRHATSKLSTVHFVTLEQHKQRLIRMGEPSWRIFVIGNLSLDKFVHFSPLDKQEIKKRFGIKRGFDNYALVIFHPTLQDKQAPEEIFETILKTLKQYNIQAFVSYPNIDPGNYNIRKVIEKYAADDNFVFYKNMDRELFLSVYKQCDFIVGNSSSGICEAASIPVPALNIGTRQTGRYASKNVVFVDATPNDIAHGIAVVSDTNFWQNTQNIHNPYGDGNSAKKAYQIIKETDFKAMLLKKEDPLETE